MNYFLTILDFLLCISSSNRTNDIYLWTVYNSIYWLENRSSFFLSFINRCTCCPDNLVLDCLFILVINSIHSLNYLWNNTFHHSSKIWELIFNISHCLSNLWNYFLLDCALDLGYSWHSLGFLLLFLLILSLVLSITVSLGEYLLKSHEEIIFLFSISFSCSL